MFRSRNDGQTRTIILSLSLSLSFTLEFTPFFLNPLCIYWVLQSLNCYFNVRSLANQPTHFSTILSWNLACGWLFLKSSDICSSPRPPRPKCSLPRPPRPKCSSPRSPRLKCSLPRPPRPKCSLFYDKYLSSRNPDEHVEVGHSLDGTTIMIKHSFSLLAQIIFLWSLGLLKLWTTNLQYFENS